MATHKRKSISKKIRFEVFKRDSFTCQYCGRMAPDVVLEIDHINPVANGGDNDILNLLTSCKECNAGKGARELSDKQAVKQQQKQLADLNEKRSQLEMMIEWKKQLHALEDQEVNIIEELFTEETGYEFNEKGVSTIKKLVKKFGVSLIIDATKSSLDQYYRSDDPNSVGKCFDYISKVAYGMQRDKTDPYYRQTNYIHGILRNRMAIPNKHRLFTMLNGVCTDQGSCDVVSDIAKTARNWTAFWQMINDEFGGGW